MPFGAEGVAPSFGMPRTRLGPGITGEATQRAWQDDIETAIEHGDAEAGVIEAADA